VSDRQSESATKAQVLSAYADAVAAIDRASLSIGDWAGPTPCGAWTARDLIGHLLAIVRYWLRLMDASEAGAPLADLPTGGELAEMNARDLAALDVRDPSERSERFAVLATDHLHRLESADWDRKLGTWTPFGDLSIGEHSGIAIGEWHVHAWDLARSSGADHRPSDPFVVAAGQQVLGRPIAGGDPWTAVLTGYERDPEWRAGPPG
jgi:uncharacterized protein (TIGR03083 family)